MSLLFHFLAFHAIFVAAFRCKVNFVDEIKYWPDADAVIFDFYRAKRLGYAKYIKKRSGKIHKSQRVKMKRVICLQAKEQLCPANVGRSTPRICCTIRLRMVLEA